MKTNDYRLKIYKHIPTGDRWYFLQYNHIGPQGALSYCVYFGTDRNALSNAANSEGVSLGDIVPEIIDVE
jgi:hypothetical protein